MKRMEIDGINKAFITLHCGLGNFHEIEVEDLTKHKMDSEQMIITKDACELVNNTKLMRSPCLCHWNKCAQGYRDSCGYRWYDEGI